MNPALANIILGKLQALDTELVALEPKEHAGTGLQIKRVLRSDSGPIFVYVDRLELIEYIRVSSKLYIKGTPLCHISS